MIVFEYQKCIVAGGLLQSIVVILFFLDVFHIAANKGLSFVIFMDAELKIVYAYALDISPQPIVLTA